MNNFIIINRTYCECTPESVEDSSFSDHGFISREAEVSFSELVELMKVHNIASCSPDKLDNLHTWYHTDFFTTDYRTGTEREESIHFSNHNTPNAAKYWFLARKIANK